MRIAARLRRSSWPAGTRLRRPRRRRNKTYHIVSDVASEQTVDAKVTSVDIHSPSSLHVPLLLHHLLVVPLIVVFSLALAL